MMAKAVANATTASFITMVGSEFVQKYLGEWWWLLFCEGDTVNVVSMKLYVILQYLLLIRVHYGNLCRPGYLFQCLTNVFFFKILIVGEGPRMVRDVFRLAKENSPAIVFIDEVRVVVLCCSIM